MCLELSQGDHPEISRSICLEKNFTRNQGIMFNLIFYCLKGILINQHVTGIHTQYNK